jgi:hypothetical protein
MCSLTNRSVVALKFATDADVGVNNGPVGALVEGSLAG